MAQLIAFSAEALAGPENLVLIEGVGGAFVPLANGETVADWIRACGTEQLVVTGSYLGSISHSLATVEALRARALPVRALILCESPVSPVPIAETAAALSRHLNLPVLLLPRLDTGDAPPDLLSPLL